MILIDMNQISLASLMMHLHMNKGELEEDMVRHMILNSVRMYRTMFNEKYGETGRLGVNRETLFTGFDGYIDAINLADVVILTTPPAVRP